MTQYGTNAAPATNQPGGDLRLFIAGGTDLSQESLKLALDLVGGVDLIGVVRDLTMIDEACAASRPEAVVVESDPGGPPLPTTVRSLRDTLPDSRIIVLADDASEESTARALGADDYVVRGTLSPVVMMANLADRGAVR